MTNIRPANPDHSIVEVIFAFQFANDLDEHQLRSVANMEFRGLPRKQETAGVQFPIRDGVADPEKQSRFLAEIQFSHHKSDGRPDWILRVTPKYVTVSCFDYDRWERVWPRAGELLRLIAPEVIVEKSPIGGLGLQYIDRFVYEGIEGGYAVTDLFDPDSPYLTKHVQRAGALWHVHQGWFDVPERHLGESCRILNRLNISASKEGSEHQTIVDHQMAFLFSAPIGRAVMLTEGEESQLTRIMDVLHAGNKAMLRGLLTPGMLGQIGMG